MLCENSGLRLCVPSLILPWFAVLSCFQHGSSIFKLSFHVPTAFMYGPYHIGHNLYHFKHPSPSLHIHKCLHACMCAHMQMPFCLVDFFICACLWVGVWVCFFLYLKWFIIIIINPLTARVVGAPQMILQPFFSTFPCSPLPSGTCWTPGLSIPWCCLPASSSVCHVFFPLSLCLARWFWPDLMNGRHDHTTAVCVSLRSSGGLRLILLPAGSWHGLLIDNMVFVWGV